MFYFCFLVERFLLSEHSNFELLIQRSPFLKTRKLLCKHFDDSPQAFLPMKYSQIKKQKRASSSAHSIMKKLSVRKSH